MSKRKPMPIYEIKDNSGISFRTNIKPGEKRFKNKIKKAISESTVSFLPEIHCCHCDKTKSGDISFFDFEYEVKDGEVSILHLTCIHDYENYSFKLCYNCFSLIKKHHNPNSIYYVSKKFGVSEEEASNIIHTRNSSPFYRINHDSEESYLQYQNAFSRMSDEERDDSIRRAVNKRKEYRDDYIERYGYDKWKRDKRDSSSLEKMIDLYGPTEGPVKFKEKGEKTRGLRVEDVVTLEEKIKWFDVQYSIKTIHDFKSKIENKLEGMTSIGKILWIDRVLKGGTPKYWNLLKWGVEIYNIDDIYKFLEIKKEMLEIRKKIHYDNKISYSCVHDGLFFRSNMELDFYLMIKDYVNVLDANKKYENAEERVMYDFKILYKNEVKYIEICGVNLTLGEQYMNKQEEKRDRYGAILVDRKHFVDIISDMKAQKDLKYDYTKLG